MRKILKTQSKFLSLILRHSPEKIGVKLDQNGWISVDELLKAAVSHGQSIDQQRLIEIVETNDKQRFSFSEDGFRIRANQGHSIAAVDLALTPCLPPDILYHGTVEKFLPQILDIGLNKMSRQHVHLSSEKETAEMVGQRRGKPVILSVHAKRMIEAGHEFYLSKNGVWLTASVPPIYISDERI